MADLDRQPLALITGASSGIGAATAKAFAAQGYHVLLLARRAEALEAVAEEIRDRSGRASCYPVDVTDFRAVRQVCEEIRQRHGIPDVLFNNAGIGTWRSVVETEHEEVAELMGAPYFAAFYLTREFLPGMLQRRSGHILNITSPVGFFPVPGAAAYAAARWAVRGFHESLWAELKGTGVAATLVVPGKVSSAYFVNNPGSEERIPGIASLLGTLTPESVAAKIIRELPRRPKIILQPFMLWAFLFLYRFAPRTVEWLTVRTGWSRPKH